MKKFEILFFPSATEKRPLTAPAIKNMLLGLNDLLNAGFKVYKKLDFRDYSFVIFSKET